MIGKQIDKQKSSINSIDGVFTTKLQKLRDQLIKQSEILIFKNHESIGRRSREFLWRKGYYEFINIAKRTWPKKSTQCNETKLIELIFEGIEKFKNIILSFEHIYNLNLKYIIDFELLSTDTNYIDKSEINEKYGLSTINYAMESVHSFLISIGDLHRYYIDFKLNEVNTIHSCKPIYNRDIAAKYYFEAFKLNPKIGMPQNQLGTLYAGYNYNFDSIYYYLYSLACLQPFELSENNAIKIFQTNSEYLESIQNGINFKPRIQDFLAQFILIVDIYFYDKNVTDFNMLCHSVLVDFRKLLISSETHLYENDFIFKFVSILFFCLAKLKTVNSFKIHSLNAYLVAICSELIDACTSKLEQFIVLRAQQNENFKINYEQSFNEYENNVRLSKGSLRKWNNGTVTNEMLMQNSSKNVEIKSLVNSQKSIRIMPNVETRHQSQNSTKSNNGNELINDISKETSFLSDNIKCEPEKSKKMPIKVRRRRKKIWSNNSDSDISSYNGIVENKRYNTKNCDMESDFSSEADYVSYESSSDESSILKYGLDRKTSQIVLHPDKNEQKVLINFNLRELCKFN